MKEPPITAAVPSAFLSQCGEKRSLDNTSNNAAACANLGRFVANQDFNAQTLRDCYCGEVESAHVAMNPKDLEAADAKSFT